MMLTDFGNSDDASLWYTVNDNVMGGRSSGGFEIRTGRLIFSGVTNTDGGGFSSIRTGRRPQNLAGYQGIRLRMLADGRTYRFRLENRAGTSYFAPFHTEPGVHWQTAEIPFERFEPRRRGRLLDGPPLDTSEIESIGLMIYDKRDGPFRLEVDWIAAY